MTIKAKGQNLRDLFESMGAEKFLGRINALMEGDKPALRPEDFSVRELHEAVDVSTFSTVTGNLISRKVMEAFNAAKGVGDMLVDSFESTQQIDRVAGIAAVGELDDINPGGEYPHSGEMEERYVTITGKKRGAILDITEEGIMFDQTGLILRTATQFGRKAAMDREKRILYTIQDATVNGKNYYAWYPSGSRTALYSTSTTAPHRCSNQITNKLEDFTDLDAAKVLLGKMTDEGGENISVTPKIILVPVALGTTARRLINNTVLPGGGNNEANPFNGAVQVVESAHLDTVSAAIWYFGDFQMQYAEKVVIPIQVKQITSRDSEERDIVASYKVRHYTQVGAVDHRFVVKSTGAN